jgi:hypothetical protein
MVGHLDRALLEEGLDLRYEGVSNSGGPPPPSTTHIHVRNLEVVDRLCRAPLRSMQKGLDLH